MTIYPPASWADASFWKVVDDIKVVLGEIGLRLVSVEARLSDHDLVDFVTSAGTIYFSFTRPTAAFVFSVQTPDAYRGIGRELNTREEASPEGFRAAFLSALFDMLDFIDAQVPVLPPNSDKGGVAAEFRALLARLSDRESKGEKQ